MSRLPWLVLLTGLLLGPLRVGAQCPGVTTALAPFASETLTVSTVVQALTAAKYQQASGTAVLATIQVQQAPLVYSVTTAPTSSSGTIKGTFAEFGICGLDSIKAFKAIRFSTTDSVVVVNYYKPR
jgi:hypothetical protein